MQITSGLYKGHKLRAGNNTRPTMGRVREAIFNILLHNQRYSQALINGNVLDLFCGSGAMGLEALSHRAKHAFMIDMHTEDVFYNSRSFVEHVTIMCADATNLPHARQSCDLAFVDPPYHYEHYEEVLHSLITCGWVKHNSIVVVETDSKKKIKEFNEYELLDEREYGKARVLILRATMPFDINEIRKLLTSEFSDAEIDLQDTAGDGDHFSLIISSGRFRGKSMIEQHQMVYQALQGKVGDDIHALQLKTIVKE